MSIIAKRELILKSKNKNYSIILEIGIPMKDVQCIDSVDYSCSLKILIDKQEINTCAYGIDSLQALKLTINSLLPQELKRLEDKYQGKLYFLDEIFDLKKQNLF